MSSQKANYDLESLKNALNKHDENIQNIKITIERENDAIRQAELIRGHIQKKVDENPTLGGYRYELERADREIEKAHKSVAVLQDEVVNEIIRRKETESLIRDINEYGV